MDCREAVHKKSLWGNENQKSAPEKKERRNAVDGISENLNATLRPDFATAKSHRATSGSKLHSLQIW